MRIFSLILCLFLGGCVRLPKGIEPVQDFELDRYMGMWYEIARLDHSFERGLSRVTAEYSLEADGTVQVVNRGFSKEKGEWKTAHGKARFVNSSQEGFLKVSFFGPFYGSYIVVELDRETYQYALVSGPDRQYLWLLARDPHLSGDVVKMLIDRAKSLDFPVDQLILVEHETGQKP
ncbi:lipocalin family protein [Desulfopila aestuarii]|uniref:Outer membrane lipoprotein Blc n=1 Tax=Desulfopila aestuarii DSM 18488 TaxID=1121416 RepID=A0A1M7Y9S6_9BACT|nr:apolipoprotein D and lipocalin family protein [Desulfopila aestuarii DSM 18488]